MHGSLRVGFLGLGTMGLPMAMNIAKAGFPLTVWNRTASKMESLATHGVATGKGPAHVAAEVDLIITMLSGPQDVEAVMLGPDGVSDGIKSGAIVIDMSTVSPSTSRKVAGAIAAKQAEFLDAPVVGSKAPATHGELVILVGGLPTTLERAQPVFAAMGKKTVHAGAVGAGSMLKLATNLMLAHLMAGFSEGVLLLERAGVDVAHYLDVLEASTFPSPWYGTKGIGLIKREFAPHFALKHMHKDTRLMLEVAQELQTALPITKAVEQLYARSEEAGKGELDYSAIIAYLEEASGSGTSV